MAKQKLLAALLVGLFLFFETSSLVYSRENYPQRIISLASSITESLYVLGVGDKLVGCTIHCQRPPEAKKKEKVGTSIEVNLEEVISLKPDLVLATSLTRPEAKEKLKNLGIKVITFPTTKSFDEICKQFLGLGRILGKEKEAEEIVHQAKMRIGLIKEKIKNLPKQKVFVQIGARPLHAATKDFSINDAIEFAGGINIARTSKSGFYSREKVLENNPDVIIIITMGIVGEEEREIWKKYKTLNAVRNNRVYIVGADNYCSPTPISFVESVEEMVEILHPKDG